MKLFSLLSFAVIFIFSCNSGQKNEPNEKISLPPLPPHIQKKVDHINYLDSAKFAPANLAISQISKQTFKKLAVPFELKIIETCCAQSKGYQQGIWEGKNDCSWAVEKNNLEIWKDLAQRKDDTLQLSLENSKKMTFVHDKNTPQESTFYQFKQYLKNINYFVVEEIQNDKCTISKLVNALDGSAFSINGKLFFSTDQKTFLATSFNPRKPISCTNKLELYTISENQLNKVWVIPTDDWGATAAKFNDKNEILLEQSTTGVPTNYKRYAKLSNSK